MKVVDQILYKNLLISGLTLKEQEEFLSIIQPIIYHEEFMKRCLNEFSHHSNISLGEHIIKDAIVTYKLAINYNK